MPPNPCAVTNLTEGVLCSNSFEHGSNGVLDIWLEGSLDFALGGVSGEFHQLTNLSSHIVRLGLAT